MKLILFFKKRGLINVVGHYGIRSRKGCAFTLTLLMNKLAMRQLVRIFYNILQSNPRKLHNTDGMCSVEEVICVYDTLQKRYINLRKHI